MAQAQESEVLNNQLYAPPHHHFVSQHNRREHVLSSQEGCEHGREKAWTIDPEKVIGGGVGSSVCFGIITSIIVIIVIITIIINIIILTISSIVQMMIIVVILVINMVILFLVFGLSCCLR